MCSSGELDGLPLKVTNKDFISVVCLLNPSTNWDQAINFQEEQVIEQVEKLKVFQTDGGGEFTSKAFLDWLKDKGISHQHYEPEQNGAVERLHPTVGKMARTALVA
ncbi:uncharacterized protein VP01_1633g3 [Puccinia sorghi]|uniref:Integrase catalytic domain-containing protein n=1 Tax=Puccinia sorghi TaxID=27349 RepID=A0A0L6VGU5_9BASI|nr:uncharacterized protein VP01_1633g3 [Puccinia sorghi]